MNPATDKVRRRARRAPKAELASLGDEPLWYKDAVLYELHVRAFADSDADGIGDFRGLAEKLPYLHDLGVTAIWLLPFYPSPLRDDGYDIADYTDIHPSYGTLADFKMFLREAHRLGLRVITELVINHTSDQHPWFQRARRAPPGSPARNWYVWSETPEKYKETRIIFKDFEASNWTWDPVAQAYYWHRFYSHQPDLNFDNPQVCKAVLGVLSYWLEMGVDGLRLDAVPYLYQREGTHCENLPETHAFLKKLRAHVDKSFANRMLLAEANQWPEDAVAYFGEGDECHMAFHFPLMPRMFMANRMEDRYPILDILDQTPAIPESCQWALFLRNHDELTLEMVTDEERDYMYRVFAHDPQARINLGIRRRLAPLLEKDRRRIELMNGLLFSLPGTPVIYYGDEIGMGDNIYLGDRNGVRMPMQWSADRNAGFSRANPQRLYLPVNVDPEFHYEAVNVEARQNNPHSILWWMKRLIALRKRYQAFSRGTLEFLYPENRKVLAFVRQHQDERLLVVANLSRFAQFVELNLSAFAGMVPLELFGQTEFPAIGELPYLLTLNPHAFYWFALQPQKAAAAEAAGGEPLRAVRVRGGWENVFEEPARAELEALLPEVLRSRRWFGGKGRRVKGVEIVDRVPVPTGLATAHVTLLRVEYTEGDPQTYVLPLVYATGELAGQVRESQPQALVCPVAGREEEGILFDPMGDKNFCDSLLEAIERRRHFRGDAGEIRGAPSRVYRRLRGPADARLEPAPLRAEQSNTSALFGDRFVLKLFRRAEEGVNPDLELGLFLTEQAAFPHAPPVAGHLEYRRGREEPMTLAILQAYMPNEGDAWRYTLDSLSRYLEGVATVRGETPEAPVPVEPLLTLAEGDIPPLAHELIGTYLESARLLGRRTAELHVALASGSDDPAFALEPFSTLYQRSLYQSMRSLTGQVCELLRKNLRTLPEDTQALGRGVLDREHEILRRFLSVFERKITAMRGRIHGDYHLGQVLYTGKDFVIIDFEGEPARSLSERRIKRSFLRDVAGMLRSFHYAAYTALFGQVAGGMLRTEDFPAVEPWTRLWNRWVSSAFLRSYLEVAGQGSFLPKKREELEVLLNAYLLEKAIYELGYELNNRPDWVRLPLTGISQMLDGTG